MEIEENYPQINEKVVCALNQLFEAAPPERLCKSLYRLLFDYLIQTHDIRRYDFKQIILHLEMLTDFLEEAKEHLREERS